MGHSNREERAVRKGLIGLVAALFTIPAVCLAQNVSPERSRDNPQNKPGGTIVVNPTEAECKRGWSDDTRWSQEQFQELCEKLNASK